MIQKEQGPRSGPSRKRSVVIIGSGPAGYTAAIYTARANLEPLVYAGREHGGQLMLTTDVENYPGYPEGVLGPEMMEGFRKQAERFGAEIVFKDIVEVNFQKHPFVLKDDDDDLVEAEAVIIATGAKARWLGVPGEEKLRGHGVSSCATCDGAFFKGRELVVVGGGDSAMEEANFLTRFATKVTIVHRRDKFRASKIMQDRVLANPKISVIWNSEVAEILGKDKVTGVKLVSHPEGNPGERRNDKATKTTEFSCGGVFVAIGHDPNTKIFKDKIDLDEQGYIVWKKNTMTSIEGVFAAGDCVDHRYRQAVTAAGMGCMAAIDAERWLESRGR